MKISDIQNLAIKMAISADLRGTKGVQRFLDIKKKRFESLSEKEKQEFDLEELQNPYMDSCVHNIADDREIKKVLHKNERASFVAQSMNEVASLLKRS